MGGKWGYQQAMSTIATGRRHELKCWPEFFEPLFDGLKTSEIRLNDRDFQVGDMIEFREWSPTINAEGYTGRQCTRLVTHVLQPWVGGGIEPGHVILSLWRVQVNGQDAL